MITATSLLRYSAPPAPQPSSNVRPNVEWWEVGDKRYDSTADLVKTLGQPQAATPATYHWRQETSFGRPEKMKAIRDGVVGGAIAGAMIGGIGAIGINILGFVGTVMTAGMMGIFGGVGLLGPIAVCAAAGALIGGISNPSDARERFETGTLVDGQLKSETQPDGSQHLAFYVDGQLSNRVDLDSYAQAQPGPAPENVWWNQAPTGQA